MKTITMFYQRRCPFCKKAFAYMDELLQQEPYKGLQIEKIEETEQPELADQYDYYTCRRFTLMGRRCMKAASSAMKSRLFLTRPWNSFLDFTR